MTAMNCATLQPTGFPADDEKRLDQVIREKLSPRSIFQAGISNRISTLLFDTPAEEAAAQWKVLNAAFETLANLEPQAAEAASQAYRTATNNLETVAEDLSPNQINKVVAEAVNAIKDDDTGPPDMAWQGIAAIGHQLRRSIDEMLEELDRECRTINDFRLTEAWMMITETADEAAACNAALRSMTGTR